MTFYPHKIRDPIYGFIYFNDFERKFIDHPFFQRLRRIKQLAMTDYVYPGACHTRFEHSLGVMHLASEMFDKIVSNDKNISMLDENNGITKESLERHKQIIRLAALLHDIGHGPFSHVSDSIFPKNPDGKGLTHEEYSAAIIQGPMGNIFRCRENNAYGISSKMVASFFNDCTEDYPPVTFWRSLISGQLDAESS